MTSIRDVANSAGVSTATVSRVVSGRGYVAPETRARVCAAVEELGYVANRLARGLKTQRTNSVGLLVPEIINGFYTTIVRGVEDVANANGIHVIIGNTDDDTAKEQSYLDLLMGIRVDGIIMAPAGGVSPNLAMINRRGIPVVTIDRTIDGLVADHVRSDNECGARQLTAHLIGLGCRRIALINGDPATSVATERRQGYDAALIAHGLAVDLTITSHGQWTIEDAERRTTSLLAAPNPPDAIFAANNFLALGAIRALRRRGLKVPDEVPVVCFDALSLFVELEPISASMDQPASRMGEIAMRLLLDRVSGAYAGEARDVIVPPTLTVGGDRPANSFAFASLTGGAESTGCGSGTRGEPS